MHINILIPFSQQILIGFTGSTFQGGGFVTISHVKPRRFPDKMINSLNKMPEELASALTVASLLLFDKAWSTLLQNIT